MRTGLITSTVGSSVLAALLSLVVSQTAVSQPSAQGAPDLSGLSADEQAMVARACNVDRQFNGPAKYYGCLRAQLAALGIPVVSKQGAPISQHQMVVPTSPEPPNKPQTENENPDSGASVPNSLRKRRSTVSGTVLSKPTAPSHKEVVPASPRLVVPTRPATPSQPQAENPDSGPLILKIIGLAFLIYLIRLGYVRLKTGKCSGCGARTSNATRICDSCQARLNAAETRRQEEQRREAQRQAEDTRRSEAEAGAEQRRRQEEEDRRKLHTLEDLQRLSGGDFERLIASLFIKDGYTVFSCGGSGDEGIDLVLKVGNSKDVVQCKRWKADIGSPIIREFYGSMMHAGARRGFIITTASFTQSARDFVIGKPLTLIDGEYLLGWINGTRSGRAAAGSSQGRDGEFNPYEVLGVSRGASKDEIRSAYVTLIAKYLPDKVSHLGYEFQAIAKEKALAINRAYEMLMHP